MDEPEAALAPDKLEHLASTREPGRSVWALGYAAGAPGRLSTEIVL